jgi:photosynthetic reaction center cytochrome c subunit
MIPGVKLSLGLLGVVVGVLLGIVIFTSFERPPVSVTQHGYRGTAMATVSNPRTVAREVAANALPDPIAPQDPAGQLSSAVYENVKVLGNVDASEFLRLMAAITEWVAPVQGCNYCHVEESLASDKLYTKVVARRMLQMTMEINGGWKSHVAETGVTCYTCHRGNPVPANIWFDDTSKAPFPQIRNTSASPVTGDASLPSAVFTPFLTKDDPIRVESTTALPTGDASSIKDTEWTYGLMMYMSNALGVNCTYCHNTRQFAAWNQSTPQRMTAWYGIRMVRHLNSAYLVPLQSTFPANRLGPDGDSPKVNCTTCHQGVYKPLFGASMVKDFPELIGAK